jgi:ribose 5-phosphate isomerase RpiB
VDVFLQSSFEGGRHARRVEAIGQIEDKYLK